MPVTACRYTGRKIKAFDGKEVCYIPIHFYDMRVLSSDSNYRNELRNLCALLKFLIVIF